MPRRKNCWWLGLLGCVAVGAGCMPTFDDVSDVCISPDNPSSAFASATALSYVDATGIPRATVNGSLSPREVDYYDAGVVPAGTRFVVDLTAQTTLIFGLQAGIGLFDEAGNQLDCSIDSVEPNISATAFVDIDTDTRVLVKITAVQPVFFTSGPYRLRVEQRPLP